MDIYLSSYQSPFTNSDNVFIEYNDVINSFMFTMLVGLINSKEEFNIFDLSTIKTMDLSDLYNWYLARDNQNVFKVLGPGKGFDYNKARNENTKEFTDNEIFCIYADDFVNMSMATNPSTIDFRSQTTFSQNVINIINLDVIKSKFIYTPVYSKYVENELKSLYSNKVKYVYGPLGKILSDENITNNSTFIFSDIFKILVLNDECILHNSSIAVANYKYNLNEKNEPKIDIKKLIDDNGNFRLDFFDPTT